MNRIIELKSRYELWDKCKYNPISDISFEKYLGAHSFTFLKTNMKFYNEPDSIYYFSDITAAGDGWYTRPVEDIKRLLPENLHHKIFYYYTLFGVLIILKGSFYDFPMDKLLSYFNIEKLSFDKFGIYEKRHKQHIVGITNYLNEAAKSL